MKNPRQFDSYAMHGWKETLDSWTERNTRLMDTARDGFCGPESIRFPPSSDRFLCSTPCLLIDYATT